MRRTPKAQKTKVKSSANRTTISLTPLVWEWARAAMSKKGYNNFTAYVADLIRRDRERVEAAVVAAQLEADQSPKKNSSSG